MLSFAEYLEESKDPCWSGYKMLGMKKKGKKEVPNCVPVKEETTPYWKKPSFIKRMSQMAKQERLERERKEAEKNKQVKEDAKGYKNPTGGLTQKGRDHYNNETGGHLKAPVTTPPSELKAGSKAANRRKSFCARMSGVEGPMKKPNGEPTRKALALRKWNC